MARYEYSCAKCDGPVTKTKTGTVEGKKYVGLHGWHCESCGDGVKVSRKLK